MLKEYKNKIILLVVLIVAWFVLDRVLKLYFDSGAFSLGQNISSSVLGIFHLTLVHNTGAAFGIFSQSTVFLAVLSLLIFVLLIAIYFTQIMLLKKGKSPYPLTFLHTFSVAIICAGGLGNAIDRLMYGYVVDYICFDFIDFPVFNVADIGVTCGVVLLVFAMIMGLRKEKLRKKNN